MPPWLRRRLWRFERKVNEFLEGDHGLVRILFVLLAGVAFMLLAVLIKFFIDPQSGQTWLVEEDWLAFVPEPLLRFIGLVFSLASLRYLLLPFITLTLAFIAGARYIQDIYQINDYRLAMRYLFASMFGLFHPYLSIDKGQMVLNPGEVNPLAVIGGPGYLMINPGNAVLFERLNHPSSVRGQGLHFISRFESIKEIIDLTDQHGYIEKTAAMSKDGIVVTVHDIHFRYRLWGGQRAAGSTGRSPKNPYPYSIQAIRNLVYNRQVRPNVGVVPWNVAVQGAFDGDILTFIRTNLLDTVTAPEGEGMDPRHEIRRILTSPNARSRFKAVGVELLWFDIGHFSFEDPAVEEQRVATWSADLAGDAEVLRAMGEAQRQAYHEMARAQVQSELLMSLVHSLHEAGLSGNLRGEPMVKLVLLKTSQVIESMSGVYEPSPNGE